MSKWEPPSFIRGKFGVLGINVKVILILWWWCCGGDTNLCRRVDNGQIEAIEHGAAERGKESHRQQRLRKILRKRWRRAENKSHTNTSHTAKARQ